MKTKRNLGLALALVLLVAGSTSAQTDPAIINWYHNTTGATGTSIDETINAAVSEILADVEAVYYDDDYVYVQTSGVPSYNVGPFPGNPGIPSDLDATYRIPRSPQEDTSGNNTSVGASAVGVFVNGVSVFNFTDTVSYNNQGIWNQDANYFEAGGFDDAPGHPAPVFNNGDGGGDGPPDGGGEGGMGPPDGEGGMGPPDGEGEGGAEAAGGQYHHHQDPKALREQLGDDGSVHSPIIGFAYDGYPIYGPYGYSDSNDASSAIKVIESGYAIRDITDRTTVIDENGDVEALDEPMWGPTFEEVELGAYQEDYFYDDANGDLDSHNGRFTVTPDYPEGTYAYFVTLDDDGSTSIFPHMLGSTYYGVVADQNNVTVPNDATLYFQAVPEPGSLILGAVGLVILGTSRRRK